MSRRPPPSDPEPATPRARRRSPIPGLVLRFIAFSVPIFLFWEYALRQPWLRVLGETFAASARLFRLGVHVVRVSGDEIRLAYGDIEWGDRFGMTGINVVALTALVLSTRSAAWRWRLRRLPAALGLLFATQVLGLWTDIVHVHARGNPTATAWAEGLRAFMTGFGTFLFPVAIWVVLFRDRLAILPTNDAAPGRAGGLRAGSPTGNRTPV